MVAPRASASYQPTSRRGSAQSEQSFYSAAHESCSTPRKRKQPRVALHPQDQSPSFSFVCLGTGGGPLEGDCSCYLLKPADADWQDGSIVVEGGSWLGALTDVLEQHGPDSAFYDFDFPDSIHSSYLRAGLMASFSQAFLISHAHLDHILGLVLGSASLPGKRAVYGLRPTLENILDMFNGKIWPKLASWKEDEPYTMYHMRSLENQRPYSVHPTLSVLPFALSHGLNPSVPPAPPTPTYTPAPMSSYFSKRNSLPLSTQMASFQLTRTVDERARAMDNVSHVASPLRQPPTFNSPFAVKNGETADASAPLSASRNLSPTAKPDDPSEPAEAAKARRPRTAQGSERVTRQPPRRVSIDRSPPSLDSTAFFITHSGHDRDVLFFGDVEPDCVSKTPRNRQVWAHAAERFAEGKLSAIFLECSFPKNHPTALLYGHLSVEHLFDELRVLARMVHKYRTRSSNGETSRFTPHHLSPLHADTIDEHFTETPAAPTDAELQGQLKGLGVIIIHVKPALFPTFLPQEDQEEDDDQSNQSLIVDRRTAPHKILDQLNGEEQSVGLGVKFVIAEKGMRIEC